MRFFFLGSLLLSTVATAGVFDEVDIQGHCGKRNTQVIENGDTLSVLFDDFGINMPAGQNGDGKTAQRACNFKIRITYPRDRYLSGLKQVFSGGVIKSKNAVGDLQLLTFMGQLNRGFPGVDWKRGKEITAESADSVFTRVAEETFPEPRACSGQLRYHMRIALRAMRPDNREFFIGGLDSYDAELVQKLDLIPRWKPCARR